MANIPTDSDCVSLESVAANSLLLDDKEDERNRFTGTPEVLAPQSTTPIALGTLSQVATGIERGVNKDHSTTTAHQGSNTRRRGSRSYENVPCFNTSTCSLDTTIQGGPKAKGSRGRRLRTSFTALKMWKLELLALAAAICSFGAIVVILAVHDEQLQPTFTSINTLIAIFSTILRATILFITTAVLGQLKWQWLETPRPLRHVERLINAGNGPGGAMRFFWLTWKPTQAMLAALIVIASSAIGPFSQQASSSAPCDRNVSGVAEIFFTQWLSDESGRMTDDMRRRAVNGFAYGATYLDNSSLFQCQAGNCTFSELKGITHASIGVCSKCVNAISSLREVDRGRFIDYYFPGDPDFAINLPIDATGLGNVLEVRMMPGETPFNASASENITISTIALTIGECSQATSAIGPDRRLCNDRVSVGIPGNWPILPGRDIGVVAANCTMYPCFRKFKADIIRGILYERLVSEVPMRLSANFYSDGQVREHGWMALIEPCAITNSSQSPAFYDSSQPPSPSYDFSNITAAPRPPNYPWNDWKLNDGSVLEVPWRDWRLNDGSRLQIPRNCTALIGMTAYPSFLEFFNTTLQGSCQANYSDAGNAGDQIAKFQAANCGKLEEDTWWMSSIFNGGNVTFEAVSSAFGCMTASISNDMRTAKRVPNMYSGSGFFETQPERVIGSGSETTVCVMADWLWLSYPGTLLLLTTGLLLAVYIQSDPEKERRPIWKSSILPILFYEVQITRSPWTHEDSQPKVPLLQLAELEQLADETIARFQNDKETPGFIIERSVEKTNMN